MSHKFFIVALFALLTADQTFNLPNTHADESIGDKVANQSGDAATNTKKALRKARRKVRDGTGNHSTMKDAEDVSNNVSDEVSNGAKKIRRKVN